MKKYILELIGTAILVFFGIGTAILSNGNLLTTSLAFGLTIIIELYIIGPISGCHINPAVSLAMLIAKKLSLKDFIYYVLFQMTGAIIGISILFLILSETNIGTTNLGVNYYGEMSTSNISLIGAFITEIILTLMFVYIVLIGTEEKYTNISKIISGITLTLVHLIGIPLTGASINPARSLAPALFIGGIALKQLWLFTLSPFLGGVLATFIYQKTNKSSITKKKK